MLRKILLFGAFLLILVAVVSTFFNWRYMTSPSFSVLQARVAVENKNLDQFQIYCDIKDVSQGMADDVSNAFYEQLDNQQQNLSTLLARGMVFLFRSQLAEFIDSSIRSWVETGDLRQVFEKYEGPLQQYVDLKKVSQYYLNEAIALQRIQNVRKEEDRAFADLVFYVERYLETLTVTLEMRQVGDHWQITQVSNLKNLIETITEKEMQPISLRPSQTDQNLSQYLSLLSLQISPIRPDKGGAKKVNLTMEFQNISDQPVSGFVAKVTFQDLKGEGFYSRDLAFAEKIAPATRRSASWVIEVHPSHEGQNKLFDTPADEVLFDMELIRLRFEDGRDIRKSVPRKSVA